MPLESIIKLGSVKENKTAIQLDYSAVDPTFLKKAQEEKKHHDDLIEQAQKQVLALQQSTQKKIAHMLKEAEHKASTMHERAIKVAQHVEETAQKKAHDLLTKNKREIEEEKEKVRKDRELAHKELETLKQQIRKEVTDSVWEEMKSEYEKKLQEYYTQLIDQVHAVLDEVVKKRREMVGVVEHDISELVLLISRKVIKVLSEKDGKVVVKNVMQALSKLKGREKFIIRINTKHLAELREYIPKIKEKLEIEGIISLVEDTSVDEGGCIVETEFGEIDARISTQLAEIEKRVRDSELVRNVSF